LDLVDLCVAAFATLMVCGAGYAGVFIGGTMRQVGRVITVTAVGVEPRMSLSRRFVGWLSDGRWMALDVVLAVLSAISAIAVTTSASDVRWSGSGWEGVLAPPLG
jgi:hypothetical protein